MRCGRSLLNDECTAGGGLGWRCGGLMVDRCRSDYNQITQGGVGADVTLFTGNFLPAEIPRTWSETHKQTRTGRRFSASHPGTTQTLTLIQVVSMK